MSVLPSATFARATLEYDEEHERVLMEAITQAIFTESKVSDCNAVVIRTGEAAQALLTVLAGILAMSPAATRSPSALRKTCDDFGKRLRRKAGAAETSTDLQDFMRRTFRDGGTEGKATRSPSALRKTCDDFGKRLRRKAGAAETSTDLQDFMRRTFRDGGTEGSA